jgi:hypothetical protein
LILSSIELFSELFPKFWIGLRQNGQALWPPFIQPSRHSV